MSITKKYHSPSKLVLNHVSSLIKPGAKILEIGPGFEPFEKATHFCGWTDEEGSRLKNYTKANVSEDKLPYADKELSMQTPEGDWLLKDQYGDKLAVVTKNGRII